MERVHCESLQPRNLYRLFVITMHYAGALTEYLHRTRSSTARTEDICVENCARRAGEVATGYFLNEPRHINVRRTCARTRRIEAVEATICLRYSGLSVEWRM